MTAKDKQVISVKMSTREAEALKAIADRQCRSVASQIRWWIAQADPESVS